MITGRDLVIYDDEVRVVPSPARFQVLDVVGDTPFSIAEFAHEEQAYQFAELYAKENGKRVRRDNG